MIAPAAPPEIVATERVAADGLPPDRRLAKAATSPLVTIVMATRNGATYLPAQLASIAAQSHRNWRLWVSDDGSTDATLSILQNFAASHQVTVVQGPCRGSSARNFLSLLCHPDLPPGIVALADQDDVWLEGKLARALRRMARRARTASDGSDGDHPMLYAAESMLVDDRLAPLRFSRAATAQPSFANALVQNLFGGHTTVLNAAALALIRRAGQQDEIAFHDWWIYQLIAGAGGTLLLDPAPMALYRQHGRNALGGLNGMGGNAKRISMALRREFARMIEAQAGALWQVSHLLTPEARATLEEFRASPGSGPARVAALRKLGIMRASKAGTAAFMAAAFLGRV